ncbi:aconitate hydratase AcnA [Catenovulum sp. 2E275]|uniref:aconitate hydratase AcnA n=1 Tax=Catenovulum sp. 2E275 TaxID=2980497 RepID=UPI0021D2688C|nr:aconitate hydratase AcnA [Catenovulum sp. 2E275]MCU4674886.1 aconitate hydratase AcnA [Catenovulum sp. 2E275]
MQKTWQAVKPLTIGNKTYQTISFEQVETQFDTNRLPYCIKILLENLLRHESAEFVQTSDIETLAKWDTQAQTETEIAFVPSRVILQDFTGVPAIVDLAAMRNAMQNLKGDPQKINPFNPVELVIDHSIMVDYFAQPNAFEKNTQVEVERNKERYQFLKWGQENFDNFKVVPPGRGIVHQVNLEYLARCVFSKETDEQLWAYPDTLVGTDSHTTMINGLGILGWGVGGIEAEAAMLGQPVSMLLPKVVGFELTGELNAGVTATDLVLAVTEKLRKHGVVGKFVEFYGSGLKHLSTADRATIANMAPEYGATCGIFPMDAEAINYLKLTGRKQAQIDLVETYAKQLGIWHDDNTQPASYHETLSLDLTKVVPSIAGPTRPQDRIALTQAADEFKHWLDQRIAITEQPQGADFAAEGGDELDAAQPQQAESGVSVTYNNQTFELSAGDIVIAAITSCTNTSNPSVLIAAGLIARKAKALGISQKPWVKTSFAPGSQVVTEYLTNAGLMDDLDALGFNLVGYGCTTCIGNSGPLPDEISDAIRIGKLPVCSILSGNRNFEGRIHPDTAANYLASPPLVVAYAIAGNMKIDITKEPIAKDKQGKDVYLKDLWPSEQEIQAISQQYVTNEIFSSKYADVFKGNSSWNELDVSSQKTYDWPESSYIKQPPFFTDMGSQPKPLEDINNARCLVKVGDSITTDHISPAGAIAPHSPAGQYLTELGISHKDFNSYGSRRGNHEIMMRGTFANVRLKNQLAPGTEGSHTCYFPDDEITSIYDAAMRYQANQTPSIVIAGKEYGTGSSRDWAAKGPALLGVKAVLAESYERIHRSNLIGMGILPLQFKAGESADSHQLNGSEVFSIPAISAGQKSVEVSVKDAQGKQKTITMMIRIDTGNEFKYYQNGGILPFVIRRLLSSTES